MENLNLNLSLVCDSLTSALNWFIPYVLYSTIVPQLKMNVYIMRTRWDGLTFFPSGVILKSVLHETSWF